MKLLCLFDKLLREYRVSWRKDILPADPTYTRYTYLYKPKISIVCDGKAG